VAHEKLPSSLANSTVTALDLHELMHEELGLFVTAFGLRHLATVLSMCHMLKGFRLIFFCTMKILLCFHIYPFRFNG